MKQKVFNTLIGLAFLSILLTIGVSIGRFAVFIHENYTFDPFLTFIVVSTIIAFFVSNKIGEQLLKELDK